MVALYGINYLLMILLPLAVGYWLARTRRVSWRLFGIGAVTFVAAQILHVPFNWLVLQRLQLLPTDTSVLSNLIILAVFLGLSAGVFEEVARYLTYRYWAKDARSWGRGLMLGAGHGGVESILLALTAALNVGMLALMASGYFLETIPAEQMPLLQQRISGVFQVPWYQAFLPFAERVFALALHLSLSLLVMQVFTRGRSWWLLVAILWHALVDALVVVSAAEWGVLVTEALLAVTALVSLGIIYWLKGPEPAAPRREPLPPPAGAERRESSVVTDEMVDRSRYS